MTARDPEPCEKCDPGIEALRWFARVRSGELSRAQLESLRTWLASSTEHLAQYESVLSTWRQLEKLRDEPSVLAIREAARRRASMRALWSSMRVAAVACCLVLVGASVSHVMPSPPPPRVAAVLATSYATVVGERRSLQLEDGSTVILDTDSAIHVAFSRAARNIVLERGRAYFRVARDTTRPFSVEAGGRTVTALGTEFEVDLRQSSVEVTLVEGKVVVRTSPDAEGTPGQGPVVEMEPGFRLVLSDTGPWHIDRTNTATDTEWVRGRLVFDEARIETMIESLNRYSRRKIVIADPAIADGRMSAVLRAGDIDTFIQAVQTLGIGRVIRSDEHTVEIGAP